MVRRGYDEPVPQRGRSPLAARGDQPALIYISTETGEEKTYTFRQLHREVNRMAGHSAVARRRPRRPRADLHADDSGGRRSRCWRARASARSIRWSSAASRAVSLATRIDDAQPKVIVSADAGSRGGKAVPYKHLLDEAIALAKFPPAKVLMVSRGLAEAQDGGGPRCSTTRSCAPST